MAEKQPSKHFAQMRGLSRLAVDATKGITDVVEAMQRAIGGGPKVLGRPLRGLTAFFTAPVHAGVRGGASLVGASVDLALAQLEQVLSPALGDGGARAEREAVLAVLNGVLGDYLKASGNPLAIDMELRRNGHHLDLEGEALRTQLPEATGKLLVLVHGSCLSDLQWSRSGRDYGAAVARDLQYTPVYLRYNTGLHVSTNGRAFSEQLEQLVSVWPTSVDELVILAHSMGGLVARSACHFGEVADHDWRRALSKLVCLGTPHHGAPLERYGSWVDYLLDISRYSAPLGRLGRIRSAGVTDLRFGNVLDEDWEARDRFEHGRDPRTPLPLPDGVDCYAIAATTAPKPCDPLPGDGLVPVDSALGRHPRREFSLSFAESRQWIGYGMKHLDLLDRDEVYAKIRAWLSA